MECGSTDAAWSCDYQSCDAEFHTDREGGVRRLYRTVWLWSWLDLALWPAGVGVLPLLVIFREARPRRTAASAFSFDPSTQPVLKSLD